MCSTCEPAVRGEMPSAVAIWALVRPSAIRRATSNSRPDNGAHGSATRRRPRVARSSSSARSSSGRLPSASAVARTSSRRSAAAACCPTRSNAAARSSRAHEASHTRPMSSQPRTASSNAARAEPLEPLAAATSPSPWRRAVRQPGRVDAPITARTSASQASACSGRLRARWPRTPGNTTGAMRPSSPTGEARCSASRASETARSASPARSAVSASPHSAGMIRPGRSVPRPTARASS